MPRLPEPSLRDHPRTCGEQASSSIQPVPGPGPSPRAGSSDIGGPAVGAGQDHPRACGEQSGPVSTAQPHSGPSPRVRGAANRRTTWRGARGTIPARAGSRRNPGAAWWARWDHPRRCGEQQEAEVLPPVRPGPSPPAQGGSQPLPDRGRQSPAPPLAGCSQPCASDARWSPHGQPVSSNPSRCCPLSQCCAGTGSLRGDPVLGTGTCRKPASGRRTSHTAAARPRHEEQAAPETGAGQQVVRIITTRFGEATDGWL